MRRVAADPLARPANELADAPLFAPRSPANAGGSVVGPVRPNYSGRDIEQPLKQGHVPIAATSKEALARKKSLKGDDALRVLKLIVQAAGEGGRTIDEVSAIMDKPPNGVTGRFSELREAGWIVKTESRRRTRAHMTAAVWSATASGVEQIKGNSK